MNPPRVYPCSPSWTLLLPPSPYPPSGSSQCTSPKHPVKRKKSRASAHFFFFLIGFLFFAVELYELFVYVGEWHLADYHLHIFFPFGRLSFCFVSDFLCCMKVFKFRSKFYIFASISFAFWRQIQRILSKSFLF